MFLLFGRVNDLNGQIDLYQMDHMPEIKLYFEQSNWDELLDSLYLLGAEYRLGADVSIDGTMYKKVGVRFKGFSSYSSTRDKNPINIDLDYVFSEQTHQGYNKLKLSNVIQDPSFVREAMTYEIARKYMPASKANFANIYINDTRIGVYTNVEAVNGTFLDKHFKSSNNTFVKCNPETINLNGANANLDDAPGTSLDGYYSLYDMKSSNYYDWDSLYHFIDVLNNDVSSIERVLNVDRTLWMHAMNYSVVNFDSYIGYAQNYYLYKDQNNQFNPILWDLNMSFASHRLTDASDNWDGFSIEEAKTIDPLQHLHGFSIHPRPLIRNVLENPIYERMYMAHLITVIEENFENGWYETRGGEIQSFIDGAVLADTNKFYSYNDFQNNFDTTISDLIDYPGIVDLMEARTNYLMSLPGVSYRPEISNVEVINVDALSGDSLWINSFVKGAVDKVYLAYRFSDWETFKLTEMFDDGQNQDGASADSVFGGSIPFTSNNVQYYIYAENDSSGRFSPARAAYEYYEHHLPIKEMDVTINEVMSQNAIEMDEFGEFDDWIELHNTTEYPIALGDLYLSNDPSNLTKWVLPGVFIGANNEFVVWLDDSVQGTNHANFSLADDGAIVWLAKGNGKVIDSVVIPSQYGVASWARYPNGTGSFQEMIPSFDAKNAMKENAILTDQVFIYPNPSGGTFRVKNNCEFVSFFDIYALDGREIRQNNLIEAGETAMIELVDLSEGIYLLEFAIKGKNFTKRIMITH